jgi:hypothetical protein
VEIFFSPEARKKEAETVNNLRMLESIKKT